MINEMRMQEIAEVLASRIAEHDQDFAREVLIDELDKNDFESLFNFVHDKDIPLRFIELMPMNAGQKKENTAKKIFWNFSRNMKMQM